MKNLEIIKNENGKTAVLCSELYKGLGLDTSHFSRWIKKNILNNPFALKNSDYAEITLPNGEMNAENIPFTLPNEENNFKGQDFALTLDFAKKLAMQCRTQVAENVRNYFLQCEKQAQSQELKLFNELMQELTRFRQLEAIRVQRILINREERELKRQMQEAPQRQIPPHGIQLSLMFN